MKLYADRLKVYGVTVIALIALVCISVSAQLPTGTFLGTVKDSTGGTVAGATVTATNSDTGFTRTGMTSDDGTYRFSAMPVGRYEIKATKEGFETTQRTGLTLEVGQSGTIDLTLQVGATSQNVVVTGEVPIVDTTSSSAGNLVNDDKINDLPLNGRNWTDLTLMQPGVTQINVFTSFGGNASIPGDNGTVYSTNGGTARSNSFLLDGADQRTMMGVGSSSIIGTSLGVDGIKEYKVVSVLPSAEYGLVMGSQSTVVSKGGTNQWHGDAFDFLRNASLDANPYNVTHDTTNFNNCGTDKLLSFPCKRIAPFQRNNFGGAFGGPIQKDKTFFYAVFEGIEQRLGILDSFSTLPAACFVNGVVPSTIANDGCVIGSAANPIAVPAAIVTQANYWPMPNVPLASATRAFNYETFQTVPSTEQYGQIRFDHTFSAADSAFFRYTQDDASTLGPIGSDPRILNNNHSAEHFGTLSETHIFTATLLNTARLSYSRNLEHIIPETAPSTIAGLPNKPINSTTLFVTDSANTYLQPGAANPGQIPQIRIPGCVNAVEANCWSQYGSATVSAANSSGTSDSNDYTLSDDVFWTKGKHAFKFGVLANRWDWLVTGAFQTTGSVTFPGVNTPTSATICANANSCPLAAYFEGAYSAVTRSTPNSEFPRQFREYTYGFYAQDDLKALSRLTLNLGFRYEFATAPREIESRLAFTLRDPLHDTTGTPGNMFTNPSLHNFSPRIGFAWDVFGNGKTSIRGGAGIYYDVGTYGNLELSNSISTPNNLPGGFVSGTITFTNPDIQALPGQVCCNATTGYKPGSPLPIAGHPASGAQAFSVPLPSVANTATVSPRTVQYNLNQPTLLQRSLGIDRQLPWNMGLSVSYVGARGWHLYQEREGNPQGYFPTMVQPTMACNPLAGPTFACNGIPIGSGTVPLGTGGATTYTGAGGYTVTAGNPCSATMPCGTQPIVCPGPGCTAVKLGGANALPFYCSPADGTTGPPSAAHPCFSNASSIPCTTITTPGITGPPSCPGKSNAVWNQVSTVTTSGDDYFNSLQVLLNKRTSHGLEFQLNYTWQKLLDTGSGQSTGENTTNPHEFPTSGGGPNGTLDRGPSQYNATDNIRGNFIYRIPDFVKSESILGKFANGWGVSSIASYQTGYPLSVSVSGDRTLYAAVFTTERADLCPSYSAPAFKSGTSTGDRSSSTFFNINMICLPPAGTMGNSPKGLFTGPGLVSTSLAFSKDTKVGFLGEAGDIQFRFEMFNAINHPNFNPPTTSVFTASSSLFPQGGSIAQLQAVGGSTAGQVSSTAGHDSLTTLAPMRQMQVSLKLIF